MSLVDLCSEDGRGLFAHAKGMCIFTMETGGKKILSKSFITSRDTIVSCQLIPETHNIACVLSEKPTLIQVINADNKQKEREIETDFRDRIIDLRAFSRFLCAITKDTIKIFASGNKGTYEVIYDSKIVSPALSCRLLSDGTSSVAISHKKGCVDLLNIKTKEEGSADKGAMGSHRTRRITFTISTHTIENAHCNQIQRIAISSCGEKIATASEVGTLIRVHDINQKKTTEYRRGAYQAEIGAMAFGGDSDSILAVTSNTGTVHMFRIDKNAKIPENTYSALSWASGMLPSYFSSTWSSKKIVSKSTDVDISKCAKLLIKTFECGQIKITCVCSDGLLRFIVYGDDTIPVEDTIAMTDIKKHIISLFERYQNI
jgi:WD40 repeat protein